MLERIEVEWAEMEERSRCRPAWTETEALLARTWQALSSTAPADATLAADLAAGGGVPASVRHEVFTPVGSGFVHTGPRVYAALTHPLVRIAAADPLRYASGSWDVA